MIRANMSMLGAEIGQLVHLREPTTPEKQPVIRMDQDTLYSAAVRDLSKPVEIILLGAGGRYMSMHVVSQDHYMLFESGPGTHELTEHKVGTRFALLTVCTFVDITDPEDLQLARKALSDLGSLGFDTSHAFGRKDEVKPIDHLVAAGAGWGAAARRRLLHQGPGRR
jgi:hypothetical protein